MHQMTHEAISRLLISVSYIYQYHTDNVPYHWISSTCLSLEGGTWKKFVSMKAFPTPTLTSIFISVCGLCVNMPCHRGRPAHHCVQALTPTHCQSGLGMHQSKTRTWKRWMWSSMISWWLVFSVHSSMELVTDHIGQPRNEYRMKVGVVVSPLSSM